MFKFKISTVLLLLVSIFFIGVAVKFNAATSVIYTNFINYQIREKISVVTNQVNFSLGEIFTLLLVIFLLLFILNFVRKLFTPSKWFEYIARVFWGTFNIISIGLFIYLLVFGLNYHTPTLDTFLIDRYNSKYSTNIKVNVDNEKKVEVLKYLIEKTIETKKINTSSENREKINLNELYPQASEGFSAISDAFPNMKGKYSIPKASFSSEALNFIGLDARYSMLFNEVTISDTIPNHYKPFVMSKYMSYQRGVAREDEAVFYAYLACINNSDNRIKYSGYLVMTKYLLESIRENDKISYNEYYATLPEEILSDLQVISKHENNFGIGTYAKDIVKKNFARVNGDFRLDSLENQVSYLISTYYSLFVYN